MISKRKVDSVLQHMSSESGFSLTSIMIGGVIMSIMAAGMANMLHQASTSQSYLEDRMELQETKRELTMLLSNPETCTATFEGSPVVTELGNSFSIRDANGEEKFNNNRPLYQGSRLRVTGMSLRNEDVEPQVGGRGTAKLLININRQSGSIDSAMKPIEISLNVAKFPGNHRIETCSSEGGGALDVENVCVLNMGEEAGMRLMESGTTFTYDVSSRRVEEFRSRCSGIVIGSRTTSSVNRRTVRCDGTTITEVGNDQIGDPNITESGSRTDWEGSCSGDGAGN